MIDVEVGDIWRTKRDPVDCEVTKIQHGNKVPIITSYSADDDCTDSCTYHEFLRDYYLVKKADKTDMVNHPPHYKDASGVGCTEVVKHMMFFGGACFKYLYRCGNKWDDIEDLKKAARCAELAAVNDRPITDETWVANIRTIAHSREGRIKGAMLDIAKGRWLLAMDYINDEIARLESE